MSWLYVLAGASSDGTNLIFCGFKSSDGPNLPSITFLQLTGKNPKNTTLTILFRFDEFLKNKRKTLLNRNTYIHIHTLPVSCCAPVAVHILIVQGGGKVLTLVIHCRIHMSFKISNYWHRLLSRFHLRLCAHIKVSFYIPQMIQSDVHVHQECIAL